MIAQKAFLSKLGRSMWKKGCDELLLLCELRQKNVIIFGRSGSQAQYGGSVTERHAARDTTATSTTAIHTHGKQHAGRGAIRHIPTIYPTVGGQSGAIQYYQAFQLRQSRRR